MSFLFTSESVSIGHPDKIADQISDAILDACLAEDSNARVACQTLVTTGLVIVAGEITTGAVVDYQEVVRETIKRIGYDDSALGFDFRSCGVLITLHKQSPDIAIGVDHPIMSHGEANLGAGDQGLMFGFACDETEELMPLPISIAHKIVLQLHHLRETHVLPYLRPDAKAQCTVEYGPDHIPKRIHTIVVSTQHAPTASLETIEMDIGAMVRELLPSHLLDSDTIFYINPTGRFVIGGPAGDCGLTGRKIIVDTYGGMGRHGGGAFSGKDPTKVDRSGAYAARYVAKNIVAANLARRCEVQLAYAIGVPYPISIHIDSFGTATVDEKVLQHVIPLVFDLTPKGIIQMLDLQRPIYSKTAYGGHFGRNLPEFSWEKTDKVEALHNAIKRQGRQLP
jgi:S-adenosylmethionine synthetase